MVWALITIILVGAGVGVGFYLGMTYRENNPTREVKEPKQTKVKVKRRIFFIFK